MLGRSIILGFVFVLMYTPTWTQTVLTQPVKVVFQSVNLEQALLQLISESSLNISFSNDILPDNQLFSQSFNNEPASKVLDFLLAGTAIAYKVVGRQIVLYQIVPQPQFYTISGILEDRFTGERLIGANVYETISLRGTTTNAYGFYSLTLPEGAVKIVFSYLGYQQVSHPIRLEKDKKLDIFLESDGQLEEVIVLANTDSSYRSWQDEGQTLDLNQLRSLPALGGEPDLIRYTSLQPGVLSGTDGFGGVHVRGGNADQNLFLLDGVPVYSPTHAAGMLSIFDSPAIRSAQLHKGSFPARYGGRLSSVYDVRMKEGNNKQLQGEAAIGLVSAKVAVEGPIDPEVSSFFVSARRSIFDPWLRSMTKYINQERGNSGFTDFHFYDVNGKMNFKSGNDHRFYVSLYHGNDVFHQEEGRSVRIGNTSVSDHSQADLQWGNTISSFRWNWLLHPKWFINTTVYSSSFKFDLLDFYEFENDDGNIKDRTFDLLSFSSLIQDIGAKVEAEYHPGGNHKMRIGGGLVRHRFQPGVLALDEKTIDGDIFVMNGQVRNLDSLPEYGIIRSLEYDGYVEDQIMLSATWSANLGAYVNYFYVQNTGYFSVQPRLGLRYNPSSKVDFTMSYGHMTQNLHLLTNSGIGLPSDLWVPVTGNIRPQKSNQFEMALITKPIKGWEIELGLYLKKMTNLLAWKEGANFLVNGNILSGGIPSDYWESFVTSGSGLSRGLELSIRKTENRWTGGAHYSLAKTEHQFDAINGGQPFPFRYDRRHTVHLFQQIQIRQNLGFNILWTYGSGNPITLPIATYDSHSPYYISPGVVYSGRNEARLKDYHRLDFTFRYSFTQKRLNHTFDLGMFNVYNRLNPLFIRIKENIYNPAQRSLVEVSLLPILPVFSYQIRFQ
ncbi:MAG: TonB-dependent receptor [Saprospiraceae bacterium]|nr:TonB-dependent receptor [Saprospiraceae bacterium]